MSTHRHDMAEQGDRFAVLGYLEHEVLMLLGVSLLAVRDCDARAPSTGERRVFDYIMAIET